jgi:hypothetical protein
LGADVVGDVQAVDQVEFARDGVGPGRVTRWSMTHRSCGVLYWPGLSEFFVQLPGEGVATIRNSKFGKSRQVALHPSTTCALLPAPAGMVPTR